MDGTVPVGRVVKPHGIRGELVVESLSDVPGRLDAGVVLTAAGRERTVVASRPHQGRVLLRFEDVTSREGAERLRGELLHAPPVDVSDSENLYAHEVVGLPVVDVDGLLLGTVADVVLLPHAAGYDLLEVEREDGPTWLLPAHDDVVELGETDDGRDVLVVVDPPDGLLDL